MALAATDYGAAALPDARLRERFRLLLADLDAHPGCSLPQACRSPAALKAAYRFFDHPDTSVANLLPAFVVPCAGRARRHRLVLAVHDSTSFNFSCLPATDGLGFLNDSPHARGIHLHSSLLLDEDGCLLGIAHLHFWVRHRFRDDDEAVRQLPIEHKESFKWLLGVRASAAALQTPPAQLTATARAAGRIARAGGRDDGPNASAPPRPPRVIHVMDREGDIHEVFAEIRRLGHGAVIRCAQDRRVEGNQPEQIEPAKQRVAAAKPLGTMPLRVPLKEGGYRTAVVAVRAQEVRLRPNEQKRKGRKPLRLGLVEVREVSTPPEGEKAASWWLWTTLRVCRLRHVERVLKIYQARWRVEDYHRALKTGCAVERLRLDSAAKRMKAITMKAWVATRVVQLRDEVKHNPQQDCGACFGEAEWQLLWQRQHGRRWRVEDGRPALVEVVKWLGRLGGHLGRKGDPLPGTECLSRALYALDLLLEGHGLGRAQAAAEGDDVASPDTDL